MRNQPAWPQSAARGQSVAYFEPGLVGQQFNRLVSAGVRLPRQLVIGLILGVALIAFEIFNFDTTRFALHDLLGDVRFAGFQWAAILALAFCAIDFAGLVRLFTPERGRDEPKEVWYLMGAWLLGATMNAVMTWWAVSLTLMGHNLGNEILSREELLHIVPVFVAVLVWLTRILFIGAFSVAGERLLDFSRPQPSLATQDARPAVARPGPAVSFPRPEVRSTSDEVPGFLRAARPARSQPTTTAERPPQPSRPAEPLNLNTAVAGQDHKPNGRVRQRPPVPNGPRQAPLRGVQARGRNLDK